ncbi:MAG: hypothetical protein CM15mP18_0440 [Methanobacteriota archaeon]|nr:MAG: hypothetical protein CM15mP18_0440 [Euryarchaeota archaeon]
MAPGPNSPIRGRRKSRMPGNFGSPSPRRTLLPCVGGGFGTHVWPNCCGRRRDQYLVRNVGTGPAMGTWGRCSGAIALWCRTPRPSSSPAEDQSLLGPGLNGALADRPRGCRSPAGHQGEPKPSTGDLGHIARTPPPALLAMLRPVPFSRGGREANAVGETPGATEPDCGAGSQPGGGFVFFSHGHSALPHEQAWRNLLDPWDAPVPERARPPKPSLRGICITCKATSCSVYATAATVRSIFLVVGKPPFHEGMARIKQSGSAPYCVGGRHSPPVGRGLGGGGGVGSPAAPRRVDPQSRFIGGQRLTRGAMTNDEPSCRSLLLTSTPVFVASPSELPRTSFLTQTGGVLLRLPHRRIGRHGREDVIYLLFQKELPTERTIRCVPRQFVGSRGQSPKGVAAVYAALPRKGPKMDWLSVGIPHARRARTTGRLAGGPQPLG